MNAVRPTLINQYDVLEWVGGIGAKGPGVVDYRRSLSYEG